METPNAADLRNDFLGIKWGAKLDIQDGFQELETKANVTYYRNPKMVYTVEDFTVSDVIYGSHSNRFFAVYIQIESLEVFGKIRQHLSEKYGEPKISLTMKNEQRIYSWKYKKIKIKLKHYVRDGKMKLSFYYTPLSNQVNEIQQEQYLDRRYRFFPIEKDKKPILAPLLEF
jgi:hypothetical protein